jgi:predicted MFS family arabinose efflux permease
MRRDFWLLQAGQLLSEAGSQATTIAYPLLALALTDSPAKAGVVAFARAIAYPLCGLFAGVVADRYDRRRVMIGADVVRAAAIAVLALGSPPFWVLPVVAFVEGAGSAFFRPAAAGALRSVVPADRLREASGIQQARIAAVGVAGPPLGGALFGIARSLPFIFDALSYLASIVSLLAMRTPFQEQRARVRPAVREGLRFVWAQPFLRVTTLIFGLANFIGPGLFFTTLVLAKGQGLGPGTIGLLLAVFSVGLLGGALLSPLARRALPARVIVVLELWTWTGCGLFLVWPNVGVLVAAMLPCALAIPITNSVVFGHGLELTPDRLVGRVESVRSTFALSTAPLGPLVAGALLDQAPARVTVGLFAVIALALAVWGTSSPAVRSI